MSRRPRRNHTSAFKAKVALAAFEGDRTITQLAEHFDVPLQMPNRSSSGPSEACALGHGRPRRTLVPHRIQKETAAAYAPTPISEWLTGRAIRSLHLVTAFRRRPIQILRDGQSSTVNPTRARDGYRHQAGRGPAPLAQPARGRSKSFTRDWEVNAVMSSDLPADIQTAIAWIDAQEVAGDPLVRLLISPAYHVTAFWLEHVQLDKILIVSRPDWFSRLNKQQFYNTREFLISLAQEHFAQPTPWRVPRTAARNPI